MRKRIDEIAGGRVECIGPAVEFSVSRIEIEVPEGEDFQGEFTITSTNHIPIRGFAYSSHPRMECLTERLEGEKVLVRFLFHGDGLSKGEIREGEFFIICSQGEYGLSFAAVIAGGETRGINSLQDFAEFAKEHWQDAKQMFYSDAFSSRFGPDESRERLMWEGLSAGADKDLNLEEFLKACGLKGQVTVTASQTEFELPNVTGPVRQEIALTKQTWGYVGLHVESDADFVGIEKRWLGTEDFLGSEASLGIYIYPEKMHAGRNYGRVLIWNMYQEISVSICASLETSREEDRPPAGQIRRLRARLLSYYAQYRLKKIVTGKWTALTCQAVDDLMEIDPDNAWYRLIKAQALLANGQRQDAEWLLKEFKRKNKDQRSPQWGYFMYISTLIEHEELYINRLISEIEQIYLENQENILLFFCLLFLREEYALDSIKKLNAIEEKVEGGWDSPLLYAEAYSLYCKEPYLLRSFGSFEVKILNWARKQEALTKEIAEQAVSVFSERVPYKRIVFLLLEECYRILDDEKSLSAICGYLIRNQKRGAPYFPWYALGVRKKLRITGLYEAYLLSMDARSVQEVPQIIRMYFKYNNQIDSRQQAILHVNIIASKASRPEVYEQNYMAMAKFAYAQMEQGVMDDNMAAIYNEVLSGGIYSAEIANSLAKSLFVHRLTCFEPGAARVIVLQKQLAGQTAVPLTDGVAYFPLYSNDYCIIIEDVHGNRYGGSVPCQLEKLMHPGKYLRSCMRYAPSKLPYLLYYFASWDKREIFEEKDLPYFREVMASPKVNGTYRAALFPKYFRLLNELNLTDDMARALQWAEFSRMEPEDRKEILSIAIERKLYDQAFLAAGAYGFDLLPADRQADFLCYRIKKLSFAKDRALMLFCAQAFLEGERREAMLRYLCSYYQGPAGRMADIFKCADEAGIDTEAFAERILTQMLYTGEFAGCADAVCRRLKSEGSRRLKEAYLTYVSYRNFVKNETVPDGFFQILQAWQAGGGAMSEPCSYALLRYFAGKDRLLEQEKKQAEQLLVKSLFQGTCFAFYKNLDSDLAAEYRLSDRFLIEHRTRPGRRVWLRYATRPGAEPVTEEMTEIYGGIFVKELILFFGDTVSYTILEEEGGRQEVKERETVTYAPSRDAAGSRYERLNEMLSLSSSKEGGALAEKMREYANLDYLAGQMFTIIK